LRKIDARLAYVPELDGLRGVAILLVVGFHAGVPGFGIGGYLGVDLFFVLSGYLITSVILREIEMTGRFDVLAFYARRSLRLFPALLLVCVALALAAPFLSNTRQIVADEIATLGYIANWTRAFGSGSPMYLGHAWSLAIEEQFYLIWPALLLVALSFRRKIAPVWVAVALAASVAVWRGYLAFNGAVPDRLYNGTDTRLDGLFIGCALALFLSADGVKSYYPRQVPRAARVAALLVFAALIAFMPWNTKPAFVAGYIAASLCAAVIIFCCVSEQDSGLRRIMRIPALVYVGKISYSLYLWHYPIFLIIWLHWGQSDRRIAWASIPLAFAFSALTYHSVEARCRRVRDSMSPADARAFGAVALMASVSAIVGASVFFLRA
jgi:peptidoglycan/LPS O-acetylase OafA/YrhL